MSKNFIPQYSPPDLSKEFVDQEPGPGRGQQSVIPMEWPHLQSNEILRKWEEALKEKEEGVLKQARERALAIEKEAYEKGFAQGEKDGLELGRKRLDTVIESLHRLVEGMGRLHQDLYEQYEPEMIRLVFAITRKILQQDILLPEEGIKETLRNAFQYVIESKDIVIRLNPRDHEYVLRHPGTFPFIGEKGQENRIQIIADPSIARGGCFLETSFGEIDGTLENQVDQICSLVWQKFVPSGSAPGAKDP